MTIHINNGDSLEITSWIHNSRNYFRRLFVNREMIEPLPYIDIINKFISLLQDRIIEMVPSSEFRGVPADKAKTITQLL